MFGLLIWEFFVARFWEIMLINLFKVMSINFSAYDEEDYTN